MADWWQLGTAALNAIAANEQSNAANDAAQAAAQAVQFKPFGVTSRFGRSGFQYDANGNLIGAGYQAAPDIAAMREGLLNMSMSSLPQFGTAQAASNALAQQGFNLGQLGSQYIAQTPQAAAADWMAKQQALLQPSRDTAYGRMQQNLFNTGRGGLSLAQGGNLGAANPEAQAYYNALAQQDAQLAAQAMQAGQEQTRFGAGLLGSAASAIGTGYDLQASALKPSTAAFNYASGLEGAAKGALDMATSLGAQQSSAASAAAPYIAQQGTSPWATALSSFANTPGLFSGMTGSSSTPAVANTYSSAIGQPGTYNNAYNWQQYV